MQGWEGNWCLSIYAAFARYHTIGNAGEPLVCLREYRLWWHSLAQWEEFLTTSFGRLSVILAISTPLPCVAFIFTAFDVCLLSLLYMHFAFVSWEITVSRHTFLLVGHWAARTTFTSYDIMIPVPGDELVLGCSDLGRFNGGCLWCARESIRR